jgi:type I restriction enzyme S subunit
MGRWQTISFEQLYAEPSKNGLTRPKKVRGTGYKMVNMGEIFAYNRIRNPVMDLVPMNESEQMKYSLKPGDLLFARQSLVASGAGKCSIVLETPEITTFESHLIRVQLDLKKAVPLFYYYYFSSPAGKGNVQSLVMQVGAAGIRGSELAKLPVPHPPLPIQCKIAAILSAYDNLIENNTRRIEILEEMARSIYREWFVKFRFPGHEQVKMVESELGLIPEGWEVTSIGNHINTQKGYAFKSSWYQEQGRKIVKVSDFTDDSIDISKLVSISEEIAGQYKKHELKANDIIIQTVGSWASNPQSVVGKVIRVPNIAAKTLLNQNAVKIIPKESINQSFLFYSIKNERFKSYIIGCAQGAASQASITLDAIREFKILLPPSSFLDFLVDFVSPMWKLINNLEDKNLNLRCTRDYLLPRLISGEIDVENLDINTGPIAA